MATSNRNRPVDQAGKLHWGLIALAIVITLAIIALASNVNNMRAEKAGPAKPDRDRIFDNLKSAD